MCIRDSRRRVLHGSEPDIWLFGDGSDLGLLLGVHILSGFGNCSDKVVSSGVEETIDKASLEHGVIFLGLKITSGPSLAKDSSKTLLKNFNGLGL